MDGSSQACKIPISETLRYVFFPLAAGREFSYSPSSVGRLDFSAEPATIAGDKLLSVAVGAELSCTVAYAGRLDFSAEPATIAGR